MNPHTGIHFYINIVNFNSIIKDEEDKTDELKHAIHALDTFFSSIENYGKKNYPITFVVEKITGSRLHLYVEDTLNLAFEVVKQISVYAYRIAGLINCEIGKYKTLKDFYINVGVAFGKFYDFEFKTNDYTETTTIGYPANFAAKLQALTHKGNISISEEIYNALPPEEKKTYQKVSEDSIKKYKQDKYYTAQLISIIPPHVITAKELNEVGNYANSDNLGDIEFTEVRGLIDFRSLKKTSCKKLNGIPVFADVREFTSKFKEDGSNLDEMAKKTQDILTSMYLVTARYDGVHIQFQGDRELSLYYDVPDQTINGRFQRGRTCYKSAVLASMKMIDAVKSDSIHIGVGEDFGRIFATKIGARGEKDNILLGETVIHADMMEDKHAGKDQIAITRSVYEGLKKEDKYLADQFQLRGEYYITTIGYQQYQRKLSYLQQEHNTSQKNYNGAWRD